MRPAFRNRVQRVSSTISPSVRNKTLVQLFPTPTKTESIIPTATPTITPTLTDAAINVFPENDLSSTQINVEIPEDQINVYVYDRVYPERDKIFYSQGTYSPASVNINYMHLFVEGNIRSTISYTAERTGTTFGYSIYNQEAPEFFGTFTNGDVHLIKQRPTGTPEPTPLPSGTPEPTPLPSGTPQPTPTVTPFCVQCNLVEGDRSCTISVLDISGSTEIVDVTVNGELKSRAFCMKRILSDYEFWPSNFEIIRASTDEIKQAILTAIGLLTPSCKLLNVLIFHDSNDQRQTTDSTWNSITEAINSFNPNLLVNVFLIRIAGNQASEQVQNEFEEFIQSAPSYVNLLVSENLNTYNTFDDSIALIDSIMKSLSTSYYYCTDIFNSSFIVGLDEASTVEEAQQIALSKGACQPQM